MIEKAERFIDFIFQNPKMLFIPLLILLLFVALIVIAFDDEKSYDDDDK